jgi:type II secretory pathway component PulJ
VTRWTAPARRAPRPSPGRSGPGAPGFTLIEMLAVVGFTAVLMLFAVNFYMEITRASEAATAQTRDGRRATALLDRIARDLEAAVLVKKPDEVDPLSHPWVFLAEDRGGTDGAEHLKFITRSRISRSTALHESDLETVSYVLREGESGGLELLRWSSPRLPEELDRSFPESDVEGAVLFAQNLASFGVRFMDDSSEWKSEWDSSTLIDSSELPLAAEISVAVLPESDSIAEEEPEVHQLRVLLPVRPLDLQALFDAGKPEEGTGCSTGPTVGACLADNPEAHAQLRKADPEGAAQIDEFLNDCFSDHSNLFGGIYLVGCE